MKYQNTITIEDISFFGEDILEAKLNIHNHYVNEYKINNPTHIITETDGSLYYEGPYFKYDLTITYQI